MLDQFLTILKDATLDTLKIIPFLYLIYLLISYLEHNTHLYVNFFKKTKKFGPLIGGLFGAIPQCGFSVALADLYNKKTITLGTLMAVFIATCDEAIPILLSNGNNVVTILAIISIKVIYAVICGYIIDIILYFSKKLKNETNIINHHKHCEENHNHSHHCCNCNIFLNALKHTLKISLFIYLFNLIFTSIIVFTNFNINMLMSVNIYLQPLLTALIGLIPNCASSILLVEIYISGGITFGSLLAGLCASTGIGLVILFKNGKNKFLNNILILGLLYLLSILLGILLTFLNISL